MRAFISVAAILLVFIGSLVYLKNHSEQQRQSEFHARQTAAKESRTGAGENETGHSAQEGAQPANPNALMELEATTSEEGINCATKSVVNVQRCLAFNGIQNGGDEARLLIALSRKGHAEFQSAPHEKNGKCYVEIKITGKYNDKDIDRLLNNCEVE
ncbi:MAG: hypothetical protein ACOYMG_04355 [Candidatus Methylumidiphilus sp.]